MVSPNFGEVNELLGVQTTAESTISDSPDIDMGALTDQLLNKDK